MLSVFITPWTNPTRIQSAISTRGAPADLLEPARRTPRATARRAPGSARDHVVGEPLERIQLLMRGENLEIAEAHERRRDAADDGARLGLRIAVVEHVAHHRLAGRHEAQRARGRHAEVVHGLAAHELAHRGAQHRAAVGRARIRRAARALQLQVVARRRPGATTSPSVIARPSPSCPAQWPN